jgi:outer membrane lipoprotein-sorting protein
MTDFHEQETEFSRLLREVPCDDAPGSEHRQSLRERALAEFDRSAIVDAAEPRWKHAFTKGTEIMRRPIPRLIAFTTACLAIAAVWMLVPGGQTAAQAFNRFAEAVVTAKTAKFQMEVNVEGQPKQTFQAYFLAPEKYRQELPGTVNISDFQAGKMVSIMPEQKKVMVMNLKGGPQNKMAKSHFAQLRELLAGARDAKEDKYERLGEKEIDGKKAVGFRYDSPADTVTLWGDPATGMPVRIESVWGGLPHTETIMSHFEVNVELKESLFDTTPPAGYKVQSLDVDASATREEDLVKAFRECSDISGGDFPETLDTAGITKLIIKYTAEKIKNKTDVSDEQMQELMKQSIAIGRGFQFVVTLPETADAHYAGKGVKRDTKDRPIFWYKLEEAKKYRVIYADLSTHDADAAPNIEGARRIEKASKTSKPAGTTDK